MDIWIGCDARISILAGRSAHCWTRLIAPAPALPCSRQMTLARWVGLLLLTAASVASATQDR